MPSCHGALQAPPLPAAAAVPEHSSGEGWLLPATPCTPGTALFPAVAPLSGPRWPVSPPSCWLARGAAPGGDVRVSPMQVCGAPREWLRPCFHVRVAEGGVSLCRGRGAQLGTRSRSEDSKEGALGLGRTLVPQGESLSLLREGFWRKPGYFPRYPNRWGLWGSPWRDDAHGNEITKPMKTFGRGRSYGELNSPRGSGAAKHPSCVLKERRGGRAKAASSSARVTSIRAHHAHTGAQERVGTGKLENRGRERCGGPPWEPRCPRLKERAQHLRGDIPAVLGECYPKATSLCVGKSPVPAA